VIFYSNQAAAAVNKTTLFVLSWQNYPADYFCVCNQTCGIAFTSFLSLSAEDCWSDSLDQLSWKKKSEF